MLQYTDTHRRESDQVSLSYVDYSTSQASSPSPFDHADYLTSADIFFKIPLEHLFCKLFIKKYFYFLRETTGGFF